MLNFWVAGVANFGVLELGFGLKSCYPQHQHSLKSLVKKERVFGPKSLKSKESFEGKGWGFGVSATAALNPEP